MTRRPRIPFRLPLLVAAVLGGSMVVAPSAAAAPGQGSAPATRNCIMHIESRAITCYADFRASIASATGGRVTDAPVTAAPLDRATTERINAAGTAAAKVAGNRKLAASGSSTVVSIEFMDVNFGGGSLTITSDHGPCHDGTDYSMDYMPNGWNDQISSFQSFNNCYTTHYTDYNLTGESMQWYANDQLGNIGQFSDRISSIKYGRGPSRQELLDLCNNGTDSCEFHPQTGVSESYRDFHEVGRLYNCSPTAQLRQLAFADTTGGSFTMTTEVSATAGFNVKALAKFEVTVKQTFSRQWMWATTFTDTSSVAVPAWSWGALDRNPKLQSVSGYYELRFGSRHWGHYIWYIQNFTGTGPVEKDAGITRVRGNVMTPAEIKANCPPERVAKAATTKRVSTTHTIAPANPTVAAVAVPKPINAR